MSRQDRIPTRPARILTRPDPIATRRRDESIKELELSRQETVEHLARAIDRHDSSTGEHVHRLAALTSFLAEKLGLDPDCVTLLGYAAPMHDVGKIGTPDEILRKPGR